MKVFSAQELSVFCEQLGMVVRAGIPLAEGLEMMQEEVHDEDVQVALKRLDRELEEGRSFVVALEGCGVFPMYMTEMIKLGFESGKLEEVLGLLTHYYEREAQIGQCVRRVLVYPLILLGMMCTMILAINAHVLPVFEEVLESLGMQMSSRATGMMQMGTMITAWSAGLILCVLVSGLVLWGWLNVSGELTVVTRALHYFKSYETLEIQKFTSALTLLIGSGVPPEYAMEMARELVRHVGVRRKIDQSLVGMHAGQSLAQAVQESRLFSSLAVRMLIVGSRTGCLEEMMKKLATYYEEEVEETLERIVGRIEPITVIVLACVIGSILLSVMLPLMSMMSVIG